MWLQATSRMLDTRTHADRAAQLQFADAAQWEYEDEYDDSYDDLAPFGNDGIADAEGVLLTLTCHQFSESQVLCGFVVRNSAVHDISKCQTGSHRNPWLYDLVSSVDPKVH